MPQVEIIVENSNKPKKLNNKTSMATKSQTPPKIEYKGITLKEYFKLCEQTSPMEEI